MRRLSGSDALLWHMERDDSPMHTLKVAILDSSRTGRPITLDDVALAVGSRLGLVPRATQRVVAARGYGGRPYWVNDPEFALADHLDEETVPAPGGMAELAALCSRHAALVLPRDRATWSMTLVHGLAGGHQAVVVRIHHAMTDGVGALNMFLAATTAAPGTAPAITPPAVAEAINPASILSRARRDIAPSTVGFFRLLKDAIVSRHRSKTYRRSHPDLPPFLGARRNSFNAPSGIDRVCATTSLPLDRVKAVGRASDATVNGVLHGLIAGAIRNELIARGEDVSAPTVATFGIAADKTARLGGNHITPTNVALASHLADPKARLAETARSCREGVELRQITGVEMTGRWAEYGPRTVATMRALFAHRNKKVANHIVTANVAGPSASRWIGDVEVVDWFSFALTLNPSNVNITVYSYDGRLNFGMVATPAAMPDPMGFLDRLSAELDALSAAIAPSGTSAAN